MRNRVFAYIDESGNTDENNPNRALIIAAVVSDDPVLIQRSVKAAEKKIRTLTKDNRELKAYRQSLKMRRIFLESVAKTKFDVYYVAFDLSSIRNLPYNVETIYTFGMSMLCRNIAYNYDKISLVLDQRYSSEKQRNFINEEINKSIIQSGLSIHNIKIVHQNSIEEPLLRSIDYVVYELYQKQKKAENCCEIINNHIKSGIYYADVSWSKIKKESKTPQNDHPEL